MSRMMTKRSDESVSIEAEQVNEKLMVSSNNKHMEEQLCYNDVSGARHESLMNDENEQADNGTQITLNVSGNLHVQPTQKESTSAMEEKTEYAVNDINSRDSAVLPRWFPSLLHNTACHEGCTNTQEQQQQQQQEYCEKEGEEPYITLEKGTGRSKEISAKSAKDAEHVVALNTECKSKISSYCNHNNRIIKKVNVANTCDQTSETNGKSDDATVYVNNGINSEVGKEEVMRFRRREVHLLRELRDRTFALQEAQLTIRKLQAELAEREERNTTAIEEALKSFPCLTSAQRQLISFDNFLTPTMTRADVHDQKQKEQNVELLESTACKSVAKGNARERIYNNQLRIKNAVHAFVNRTFKENSELVEDYKVGDDCKEFTREPVKHGSDQINNHRTVEPQLYEQETNECVAKQRHYDEKEAAKDTKAAEELLTINREQDGQYKPSRNLLHNELLSMNANRATNLPTTTATTTATMTTSNTSTTASSSSLPSPNSEKISTSRTSSLSSWPNNTAICNKNSDTDNQKNKEIKNSIDLLQEQLVNKRYLINALRKRKVGNEKVAVSAPTTSTSMNNAIDYEKAANDFLQEENSNKCYLLTDNTVNVTPQVKRPKKFTLPSRKHSTNTTYTLPPFYGYSLKSQADSTKENSFDSIKENAECTDCDYEM